ncbi:hypothetical protein B0T17DRAFT_657375 [Bombardia bombarda]|uniref:DUF7932 domain-containing protein n=1 Tax=Bombardia bombarda TaxID=252184 RepID=A0AA39WGS5_9PEZI|nr:hypothetical protein B0T17DRAFT_657375 [Bombardia bombarda]
MEEVPQFVSLDDGREFFWGYQANILLTMADFTFSDAVFNRRRKVEQHQRREEVDAFMSVSQNPASIFARDACSDVFGSTASNSICTPSFTLCCVRSRQVFPSCQQYLGRGWCCVGGNATDNCYVDSESVCDEKNSVPCTRLAEGTTKACCPRLTSCHPSYNASEDFVRCQIQYSDLLQAAAASTASAQSSTSTSSTSSSSSSSSSTSVSSSTSAVSSSTTGAAAASSLTSVPSPSSTVPADSSSAAALSPGAIGGVAVAATLAFSAAMVFLYWFLRRRWKKQHEMSQLSPGMPGAPGPSVAHTMPDQSTYGYTSYVNNDGTSSVYVPPGPQGHSPGPQGYYGAPEAPKIIGHSGNPAELDTRVDPAEIGPNPRSEFSGNGGRDGSGPEHVFVQHQFLSNPDSIWTCIMQSQPAVLLSAVGQDGVAGSQSWDGSANFSAPTGRHGRPGRDALYPTAGARGGDVSISLAYDETRPGSFQVVGQAPQPAAEPWKIEVNGSQRLLLDCRGGNGGSGGFGEVGQKGGDGYDGADATKNSSGGNGGPGGDGGHGGRGTSGAAGGPGGRAFVTVRENDLDTLIGLNWDLRGGKGGQPGEHGDGGNGGAGGRGGSSYSWSETVDEHVQDANGNYGVQHQTVRHSNPGGGPGPGGKGGWSYHDTEVLYPGQDGAPGFSKVTVLHPDGTSVEYPSRYMLAVTSFDVYDENDDGINEPGEYIIITNIVVQNTGLMPGPSKLQVLVRGTKWLDPVLLPVDLPSGILPGQTVQVPGSLKAFIRNESTMREAGTLLRARDTVSLRAFSPRLQRDVPEFEGGVAVVYQYPLTMTMPKYLDCVAKGDIVRFSWQVENISKKAQGRASAMGRETGTHLSDPRGLFDLKRANPDTPHTVMDMIGVLEPGETMAFAIDFEVSDLVDDFTTGNMLVNLMLADPYTGKLRSLVRFDLRIQISPSYRYNPSARFLLVINAQSPNSFVLRLLHFIQLGLHLPVDIFNLSLNGSFRAIDTKQEVLSNYSGKTVIILGNTMNYFQNGTRQPWELLDVRQAFDLAKGGTSFLVVTPENMTSLRGFAHLLSIHIPDSSSPPAPDSLLVASSIQDIIDNVASSGRSVAIATLSVKKKPLRNLDKTVMSVAKSVQQQLANKFPLRRFLVAPCDPELADLERAATKKSASNPKNGMLAIIEGLSHDTKLVASLEPFQSQSATLSEYNMAMITHSLPFKDQCGIFWNLLGHDTTYGVSTDVVYGGDGLQHLSRAAAGDGGEESAAFVSGKACDALSWSIATQISSELSHFCAGSGLAQPSLLIQLPLLNCFFSTAPKSFPSTTGSTNSTSPFTPLLSILGHIRGTSTPLNFTQRLGHTFGTRMGKRKKKVRAVVVSAVSDPLAKLCGTVAAAPKKSKKAKDGEAAAAVLTKKRPASEQMVDMEKITSKQLAQIKKDKPHLDRVARAHELACIMLEELTRTSSARFIDVANSSTGGSKSADADAARDGGNKQQQTVVVMSKEEYAKLRGQQAERRARIEGDAKFSGERLRKMVNKAAAIPATATATATATVTVPATVPATVPDTPSPTTLLLAAPEPTKTLEWKTAMTVQVGEDPVELAAAA